MQNNIRTWSIVIIFAVSILLPKDARAQRIAVSTNALEWLTLSPNFDVDVSIAQHHTLSMSFSAAPFELADNSHLKHITITPEYRYWFTMPFYGHYVGADVSYSSYDISLGNLLESGNVVSAAANYGFCFILGKRWNIVPTAGLGAGLELSSGIRVVPVARLGVNLQLLIR